MKYHSSFMARNHTQFSFQIRQELQDKIIIKDKEWYKLAPNLLNLLYRIHQISPISNDTTICFDNDLYVKKLNGQFRGKYKPTNVLSFELPSEHIIGGDIILALQTVKKEALQSQKLFMNHLAHLIIHGLLHLQGYDHIDVYEAKEMEMQESRLLKKLGVPNPWKSNLLRSI